MIHRILPTIRTVTIDASKPPSEWLGSVSPDARDEYRALRKTLMASGPLGADVCELINVVGFAMLDYEASFKIHAKRLVDGGMPKLAIQQALIATLGATTVLYQVARALAWIDELYADEAGRGRTK